MSKPGFLQGAFVLGAAAFLSKLIGLFYVIPLKHMAGDHGLALYQAVFPIYNTLLMLSVSGVPIALSKLISERLAMRKLKDVESIMTTSFRLMIAVAVCGFFFLYYASSPISRWLGNPDTRLSIQALGLAMLPVPFVAVLRGYFYGFQKMHVSAVSQVIEQIVRVLAMVFFVFWFLKEGKDIGAVASGAALGSVAGITVSLILLIKVYRSFNQKKKATKGIFSRADARNLLALAVPISLSTLMLPLMGMMDSVTVINLLKSSGFDVTEATNQFGIYSRGVPIVQFASFYASGLAVAAVPALGTAGSIQEQTKHIYRSLKVIILIGMPASLGMMVISGPLNVLFYGNDFGSDTLMVLAASTFFMSMAIVGTGLLQGIGKQRWPALFLFLGLAAKAALNVWLVPGFGIKGAAYATVLSYGVVSIFCLAALHYFHPARLGIWKDMVKWIFPSLFMAVFVIGSLHEEKKLIPAGQNLWDSLIAVSLLVTIGLISYALGLFLFRILEWKEVRTAAVSWSKGRKKSKVSGCNEYDKEHLQETKGGNKRE